MITISGNTYPVRQQLKALGGTWNKRARGWDVPDDKAEEARAIVGNSEANSNRRAPRRSRYTRFANGDEHFVNHRGRCEDAPCCGCCS